MNPLSFYKRSSRVNFVVGLAIGLFFIFSVWRIHDFGFGNDEQWLVKRGELAYRILSELFQGQWPRPADVIFDRGDWIFHPSFYALLNYKLLGPALQNLGVSLIPSFHFLNIVAACFVLLGTFKVGRMVVGPRAAAAAVILLILFPRFQAHAQYNSKEIPMMAFALFSVYYFLKVLQKPAMKPVLLAGLFWGLSLSVHLSALVLFPVCLAAAATQWGWRKTVPGAAGALFLALGVLLISWPMLWIDPSWFAKSIAYFSGAFDRREVLFFGQSYQRNTLPWTYLPFYVWASTPIFVFICGLFGLARFFNSSSAHHKYLLHGILILWALLPIAIRMVPGVVTYNGLRHAFISVPPLLLYAGWGIVAVSHKLKKYRWAHPLLAVGLGVWLLFEAGRFYPHQGDYFNEAVRFKFKNNLNENFEFPCWATPYKESLDWIHDHARPGNVIWVPQALNVLNQYKLRPDLVFQNTSPGDFALVLGNDRKLNLQFHTQIPVFELKRAHSRLAAVFSSAPTLREN